VVQPWRVTLLARDLNALVNSDLIRNLCPPAPPELAKAAWIQPGRSSWQWWSVGADLRRAASMGGLDETTGFRVLPR
jgi:alpha-glucosidase